MTTLCFGYAVWTKEDPHSGKQGRSALKKYQIWNLEKNICNNPPPKNPQNRFPVTNKQWHGDMTTDRNKQWSNKEVK